MINNCITFCWANIKAPIGVSIGVSILARELYEAGFDVNIIHWHEKIMDRNSPEDIAKEIISTNPQLLLVSFGTNQAKDVQKLLLHIKAINSKIRVLAGGVHPTIQAKQVINWGTVDYVFVGEADNRIADIVTKIIKNESLKTESNIVLKIDNKIHENLSSASPDISQQKLPLWDGFDYNRVIKLSHGFVNVISGRGCPYQCTYCHNSVFNISLRKRSVTNIIEELMQYKNRFKNKIHTFNFGDDMFLSDPDWLDNFAIAYRKNIGNVPFAINSTFKYITEKTAESLSLASCHTVRFGLESGSERLRRFLKRPDPSFQYIDRVKLLQEKQINIRMYLMVGIPTETKDELFSTFDLVGKLCVDSVRPSIYFPYPGTPSYKFCRKKNMIELSDNSGNYFDISILKWKDDNMKELVNNIIPLQSILLNEAYLKGDENEKFYNMKKRIWDANISDWSSGLSDELQMECFKVTESLRKKEIPHYSAPIPNRPELCFLIKDRLKPIPNINWFSKMYIDDPIRQKII